MNQYQGMLVNIEQQLEGLASFWSLFGRTESTQVIRQELKVIEDLIAGLQKDGEDLEGRRERLQADYLDMGTRYKLLETAHDEISERYDLVRLLLGTPPQEESAFAAFRRFIYEDFIAFANDESSLAEEAEALLTLQSVEQELAVIVNYHMLHSRFIVSVGGGFSSGKSSFISSFFQSDEIHLPVGLEPVTAIPTYVLHGDLPFIAGFTQDGGKVPITPETYARMDHQFIETFGFDLRKLLPLMVVQTPLSQLSHICFIDTPGYNPAAAGNFKQDEAVAIDFLGRSDALIWLISPDATGTLPESDIRFLHDLNLGDNTLFVVLNKADLRPQSDLEDIVAEVAEILEDEGISCCGVSAYSSLMGQEHHYQGMSLQDFLADLDHPADQGQHIRTKVHGVMNQYADALDADISKLEYQKAILNTLSLDIWAITDEQDLQQKKRVNNRSEERIEEAIDSLKQTCDTRLLRERRRELERLRKLADELIDAVFDELTVKATVSQ